MDATTAAVAATDAGPTDGGSAGVERGIDGRRVLQAVVLFVPVVFLAWMGWRQRWTADDGFINLRIVRQLLAGNGPVFNAGDRVESGTSPAWIVLLAAFDVVLPLRLEWIAVFAGLGATVGGVAFAIFGTGDVLAASRPGRGTFVPLGALVYVVVPPAWDFATSGLETGLSILWLGGTWWYLCRRVAATERGIGPPVVAVAFVAGLGPLVRPDFLVFTVFYVIGLLMTCERRPRVVVSVVVAAFALPVLVELFRMAYFASIVPNTAVAKEATRSYWSQGWRYFTNFSGGFRLYVPVAVLLVVLVVALRAGGTPTIRAFRHIAVLVVSAAVVQALYVTRVGGDFMIGRMLLPSLFALLLPVSVVLVDGWLRWVAVGVVVAWAVGCAGWFRPSVDPNASLEEPSGWIIDERAYYVGLSGSSHPVTLDDYGNSSLVRAGRYAARVERDGKHVLVLNGLLTPPLLMPLRRDSPVSVVADVGPMGLYAYAAGVDVGVVDWYGLADTTASHEIVARRARPGHEKSRTTPWVVAQYADPAAAMVGELDAADVVAARHALRCGELAELHRATADPLDLGRMLDNLAASVRLTRFRYPASPVAAERALCNPKG